MRTAFRGANSELRQIRESMLINQSADVCRCVRCWLKNVSQLRALPGGPRCLASGRVILDRKKSFNISCR